MPLVKATGKLVPMPDELFWSSYSFRQYICLAVNRK